MQSSILIEPLKNTPAPSQSLPPVTETYQNPESVRFGMSGELSRNYFHIHIGTTPVLTPTLTYVSRILFHTSPYVFLSLPVQLFGLNQCLTIRNLSPQM